MKTDWSKGIREMGEPTNDKPEKRKKVLCNRTLVMEPAAVEGKRYVVVREEAHSLTILNEQGERHSFDKDPNSKAYFGKWFSYD